MSSIHHEIIINRPPAEVWDAARDFGALHERLAPAVIANTEMLEDAATPTRRVTFANGMTVDEILVALDDNRRRLVWSILSVPHHNAAMQIFEAGDSTRVTWTADILPADLAERFSASTQAGLAAMKQHLENPPPS